MNRVLIASLLLLGVVSVNTYAKSTWQVYTSDNFTFYSDRSPGEVKKEIAQFEIYRKNALLFLGLEDKSENEQAKVYLLKSKKNFRSLVGKGVAGYYDYTLDGPVMVMGPLKKKEDNNLVLFHEYIHYILREQTSVKYPRWYEEGLCDLLGAATVKDGKVSIGTSHSWRHSIAQTHVRIDVEDLIEKPKLLPRAYYSAFYPSSWITVHYLLLGHLAGEPNYVDKMSDYLSLYSQGNTDVQTFEKTLEVSTKELNKRIDKYAEAEFLLGFSIPAASYAGNIKIRPMSKNEVIYHKADLLINMGKESKAEYLLKKSNKKQADGARNLALLAITQGHEESFKKADEYIESALDMAGDDTVVLGHAIHYLGDKLEYLKEKDQWDESLYERATSLAKKSYARKDTTLSTPRYWAELYKLKDKRVSAMKMLMEVYKATPNQLHLNMSIAEYLAESESPKLAVPFLEKVIAFTHSEERKEKAEKLLKKVKSA